MQTNTIGLDIVKNSYEGEPAVPLKRQQGEFAPKPTCSRWTRL
jgi:hypothetical protein